MGDNGGEPDMGTGGGGENHGMGDGDGGGDDDGGFCATLGGSPEPVTRLLVLCALFGLVVLRRRD